MQAKLTFLLKEGFINAKTESLSVTTFAIIGMICGLIAGLEREVTFLSKTCAIR